MVGELHLHVFLSLLATCVASLPESPSPFAIHVDFLTLRSEGVNRLPHAANIWEASCQDSLFDMYYRFSMYYLTHPPSIAYCIPQIRLPKTVLLTLDATGIG